MLHIAICEDNFADAENIQEMLVRYQSINSQLKLRIERFSDAEQLLEAFTRGRQFDLYLLDIIMPGMDGMELAKALRANDRKPRIIFFTSSQEFAIEAFSVRAMNYLVKPITAEILFPALDDAIAALGNAAEKYTVMRTAKGEHLIRISDIIYAEITGHTICYHLISGEKLVSKVLRVSFEEAAADLISDSRFIRPHRSFLINACHVTKLGETEFFMDNGMRIPISRLRLFEIRDEYMNFLIQTENFPRSKLYGGK